MTISFRKQPAETLDYDTEFAEWLGDNDTISTASATATAGITLGATEIISSAKTVKQWVSGGTDHVNYKVTITVHTVAGRIKESEFIVRVKEV